jgi:PKHD-type hydroxylase
MTTNNQPNFTDAAELSPSTVATLDIISINKSILFSKEDCENVLKECIDELWLPSTVVGDSTFHVSRRQKLRGDTNGFPFLNIRDVTKAANSNIYDFSLMGIIDQDYPQVYRYSENNFYKMHADINPMAPSRKLTFIINLSDPDTYEGGDLRFLNIDASTSELAEQGACLVFPSFLPYSISDVTKGNKHIIIGHVHGAVFK